jgi:hypothetical protein
LFSYGFAPERQIKSMENYFHKSSSALTPKMTVKCTPLVNLTNIFQEKYHKPKLKVEKNFKKTLSYEKANLKWFGEIDSCS